MTTAINPSLEAVAAPVLAQSESAQEKQARNLYILFEGFRESFSKLSDREDATECLQVFDPFLATLKEKGAQEKTEAMRAWIKTNVVLQQTRILTHVTTIDLTSKGLTELPIEIGQLYNLRSLNLLNNSLVTLPEELLRLKKLSFLTLDQNPLKTVPEALIYAESETIRRNPEIRKVILARPQFGSNPVLNNGARATIARFILSPFLLAQLSKAWKETVSISLFPSLLSQYAQDPFLAALMQEMPLESPAPVRIRALYERVLAGVKREGGFKREHYQQDLCYSPYPTQLPLSLTNMKQRATWSATQRATTLTCFFRGCVIPKLPDGAPKDAAMQISNALKEELEKRKADGVDWSWRTQTSDGRKADPIYIQAENSIRKWMQEDAHRIACSPIEDVSFYFGLAERSVRPVWLLEELSYFPGIKKLDASRLDGLSVIPEHIFNRTMLTELDLSYSGLKTLSPSIARLTNLQSLLLHNTGVRTLPIELNQLTQLTSFSVEWLEAVPEELQNSPIAAIRNNKKIQQARTIPRAIPNAVPEISQSPQAIMAVPAAIDLKQAPAAIPIAVEKQPEEPISLFQQLISCCTSLFQGIYSAFCRLFAFLRIST